MPCFFMKNYKQVNPVITCSVLSIYYLRQSVTLTVWTGRYHTSTVLKSDDPDRFKPDNILFNHETIGSLCYILEILWDSHVSYSVNKISL